MTCGIVASAVAAVLALLASASRTTWAFARDHGLPGSTWLAKIHPGRAVPINAITITTLLCMLLGLINIGSTAAFYAIVGVTTVALYVTYMMPIIMVTIKKLKGEHVAYGPWRLGRWGLPVNLFSIAYSLFISIFLFFPSFLPVTPANFNWTVVVFFGVVMIGAVYWAGGARRSYRGPVKEMVE